MRKYRSYKIKFHFNTLNIEITHWYGLIRMKTRNTREGRWHCKMSTCQLPYKLYLFIWLASAVLKNILASIMIGRNKSVSRGNPPPSADCPWTWTHRDYIKGRLLGVIYLKFQLTKQKHSGSRATAQHRWAYFRILLHLTRVPSPILIRVKSKFQLLFLGSYLLLF